MNAEKDDCSVYSVPGKLEDVTFFGSPVPQATSTATKSKPNSIAFEIDPLDSVATIGILAMYARNNLKDFKIPPTEEEVKKRNDKRQQQENLYKNVTELKDKVFAETDSKIKAIRDKYVDSQSYFNLENDDNDDAISRFLNQPASSTRSKYYLQNNHLNSDELKAVVKEQGDKDFEFLRPSIPVKNTKKCSLSNNKPSKDDMKRYSTGQTKNTLKKISPQSRLSDILDLKTDSLNDLPSKLSSSLFELRASPQICSETDRASISSSADSSLGILPPDALEDLGNQSMVDISDREKQDMSQRFARHLNLDSSFLKDGELDFGLLATTRMNQALAARSEEDKENQKRDSRDSFTRHSNWSNNSRASTAKELSNIIGGLDVPVKETAYETTKKPLSERNSASSQNSFIRKSSSSSRLSGKASEGRQSMISNPFGDYSKFSISSEEFQSGEDAAARLRNDEDLWQSALGGENKRSLSGIYGDGDISIRTQGEKLSISSFLRSGSGPLGCLDKVSDISTPRPDFGQPVVSPEKKSRARPILPPPEEKPTFVLDDVPTKDTGNPWNPQSLVDQLSLIHGDIEQDVSVPSLSCIGNMLAEMGKEGFTPRDMIDRLMASTRTKEVPKMNNQQKERSVVVLDDSDVSQCAEQGKQRRIQAVVTGNKSFCRGYESDLSTRYSSSFNSHISMDEEPVPQRSRQTARPSDTDHDVITIDDSVAPSICNVTDFEGPEEEACICVLTPDCMDFDIFNNHTRAQHYSFRKFCYLNGQRQDSAAVIQLPVSRLTLQPGEEHTLNVTVAPLVAGTLKFKLEVLRTDSMTGETETNDVFGKVVAVLPKIVLLSGSSVNMKPVVDDQTGDFYDEFKEFIEFKNNGHCVIPLKLTITQVDFNNSDIFFFDKDKSKNVTVRLEPGNSWKQAIYCLIPSVFEPDRIEEFPVSCRVDVQLPVAMQIQLPPLASASFTTVVKPNFFGAPSDLVVSSDHPTSCKLYNSTQKPVTFHAVVSSNYAVQPAKFIINPRQTCTLQVSRVLNYVRWGQLTLHAITEGDIFPMYKINITEKPSSTSSTPSFGTPRSSRAQSPSSPSSFVPEGCLQLACTQKELVWGGCTLQQRVIKTCSLKNLNHHREKLLLKVTDSHNCFKLLNEKQKLEKDVKLSLQPMENRQISVVMLAGSTGPKWGHLTISRISSPSDKKVLPLYAFGGKAKLNIEGILQDPEQHMWLYLDPDSLGSSFTLTNSGDYSAFVKISEGLSAPTVGGGLSIAPPEYILPPGHGVTIEINLHVTPERLEYLLAQPSQTAICITRLTVTHGDESTRLRLSRLSKVNPKLANKLSLINQLLPASPIPDLDKLGDSSACAETLWLEDVNEWTIGVLVKRSALETLRLDTSVEFVDLATTVIH